MLHKNNITSFAVLCQCIEWSNLLPFIPYFILHCPSLSNHLTCLSETERKSCLGLVRKQIETCQFIDFCDVKGPTINCILLHGQTIMAVCFRSAVVWKKKRFKDYCSICCCSFLFFFFPLVLLILFEVIKGNRYSCKGGSYANAFIVSFVNRELL